MICFTAPATVDNSSDCSEDAVTFGVPVLSAGTDSKVQEQERAGTPLVAAITTFQRKCLC